MYQVLDEFVNHPGWPNLNTKHLQRFDKALFGIVRSQEFEPTGVGDYVEQKYREQFGPEINVERVQRIRKLLEQRAEGTMLEVRSLWNVKVTIPDERNR